MGHFSWLYLRCTGNQMLSPHWRSILSVLDSLLAQLHDMLLRSCMC